jgi:hypothetical protein
MIGAIWRECKLTGAEEVNSLSLPASAFWIAISAGLATLTAGCNPNNCSMPSCL